MNKAVKELIVFVSVYIMFREQLIFKKDNYVNLCELSNDMILF